MSDVLPLTLTEMGFTPPSFGWIQDPAAVAATLASMQDVSGRPPTYEALCGELDVWEDDDSDVVFWDFEKKLFGSIQPSWDQGGVGTCVSFGWGRGVNDLIVMMAVRGVIDWPGHTVATEPIYGGSRVEVGGGQISGDGSVGAWAAKWVKEWGTLLRKPYSLGGVSHDLSRYSEQLSRDWGRRGVPDPYEPEAKLYPVKQVALVTSFDQAWKMLGTGRPIPVCSNVGFDSPLVEGFCAPRGNWGHCQVLRGRVKAMRGGQLVRALACQNSWADYLRGKGEPFYTDRNGQKKPLPQGCYLIDDTAGNRMLREQDSFAIDDQGGFKPRRILDWIP